MPKTAAKYGKNIWGYVVTLVVVVAIIIALILIFGNKKSGDVEYSDTERVIGLECTDSSLTHPALTDFKPQYFKNTITANFKNNTISTITYRYEGAYKDAEEATKARNFAEADYYEVLIGELGMNMNTFSHHFVVDGNRVYLTISADAEDVSSRVASYFLLNSNSTFPKTLDAMKKAYQSKNFSCKTAN
ncbi:hypothetical protein IJG76_00515 [Candidatus Saccharibacteria bacterium]|nr:hypothetical protein [Candidatus Saccharibacteria bacterium]